MEWPANCPHPAPIENLWRLMKYCVEADYDIKSLNLEELRVAIYHFAQDGLPITEGPSLRGRVCIGYYSVSGARSRKMCISGKSITRSTIGTMI